MSGACTDRPTAAKVSIRMPERDGKTAIRASEREGDAYIGTQVRTAGTGTALQDEQEHHDAIKKRETKRATATKRKRNTVEDDPVPTATNPKMPKIAQDSQETKETKETNEDKDGNEIVKVVSPMSLFLKAQYGLAKGGLEFLASMACAGLDGGKQGYAQFCLGFMHRWGLGVKIDTEKCKALLSQSVANGFLPARLSYGEDPLPSYINVRQLLSSTFGMDTALAQFLLGRCAEFGVGMAADPVLAEKYYTLASKQDFSLAHFYLSYLLKTQKRDATQVREHLRKAAEQGLAQAQYCLAACYADDDDSHDGRAVPKNLLAALQWRKRAARQGHANSQFLVGLYYDDVRKSTKQALPWYVAAAKNNHSDAQFNLGVSYDFGDGIKPNKVLGLKYYAMSARQNHKGALHNLGYSYVYADGVEPTSENVEMGFQYFLAAAKLGDRDSQVCAANCLWSGRGVEKNKEEAMMWLRKSIDQGYTKNWYSLGRWHEVRKEMQQAKECYQKGVEAHDERAQIALLAFSSQ